MYIYIYIHTHFIIYNVQEDGDRLVGPQLAGLADALHHLAVHLVVAVREIQAGHVHARVDHLHERLRVPAGRAHGADDLALAVEAVWLLDLQARELGHVRVRRNPRLTDHLRHGGKCRGGGRQKGKRRQTGS